MKITVITATWNSEATIAFALESVARQDHPDIEHLIIDGGSKDGTLSVVEGYRRPGLRVISEPDKGIYDALNKGLRLATGDLIGFMHSDDVYADDTVLSEVAKAFQDTDADLVYGDLAYVSKDDLQQVIRLWHSGQYSLKKMKWGWMPPHPTVYMKRICYEAWSGFDERYRIAADYEAMLRYLLRDDIRVGYLPRVLVKMRVGGASNRSLKNILLKSKEDIRAMKAHGVLWPNALIWKNLSKIPQFLK